MDNLNPLNLSNLETLTEDQYLVLAKIKKEYESGFKMLNSISQKTVTFYGSGRVLKNGEIYNLVSQIARTFVQNNFAIVSGGGPGVMEAALVGAAENGGLGIGFGITIDQEKLNGIAGKCILFENFSVRKYMLRQSDVLIYAPGGVGTLDELMENITLMTTDKMPTKPLFLLGKVFWEPYLVWLLGIQKTNKFIGNNVFSTIHLVDNYGEIFEILKNIGQ